MALNFVITFFYQSIFSGIRVDWQSVMIFQFKAEGLSILMGKIISKILWKPAAEVGRFHKMPVIPSNFSDEINRRKFASGGPTFFFSSKNMSRYLLSAYELSRT